MTENQSSETTVDNGECACEEGCGCRVSRHDAFVLRIDGADHVFCCSDCADTFANAASTETATMLRANVARGQTAADIGCGSGRDTKLLSKLVGPGGLVYAVDSRRERLDHFGAPRGRADDRGEVRVRVAAAHRLRFIPDGSVDFVLSNNVLCCTNERFAAVQEIARILRPGGTAYLRVSRLSSEGASPLTDEEWDRILSSFRLRESGRDSATRWALVVKPPGPAPSRPDSTGGRERRVGTRRPLRGRP